MLTVLYYIFWALLALIYSLFAFTIFKFYKSKKKLTKYCIPAVVNCLLSFTGIFVILFSSIGLIYDAVHRLLYGACFFGALIFMIVPNILLYRLYYKKKNKLTRKEYFISSIYGLLIFVLYIVQMNVLPR